MTFFAPKPRDLDSAHVILALGLAVISLGQALQHGNGFLNGIALLYLTISLILLGWALFARPTFGHLLFVKISFPVLLLGLLLQIYQLSFAYFGDSEFLSLLSTLWQFRAGILIAGGLAVASLTMHKWMSPKWQNVLTVLVLLTLWLSGVWLIKHVPYPFIDVFVFHQNSGNALLNGVNPYTLTAPNIYGEKYIYGYGAELIQNGVLTIGNPYPPLSIYFSSLGYLFGGDIRYSHLFAFVLSGALIAFLHPGRGSKLAAYLFLFTPKSFYVIEQSWTEPIVVLFLTAVVYCAIHRPRWLFALAGLLFASKQYLLFTFPLMLLLFPVKPPFPAWLRRFSEIGLVALAVTAPLALWDFPSFMWNVGEAQWYQIFRLDALSYLAAYARVTDIQPSQLIAFAMLALAFFFVWRFLPRTPDGFVAAFAWCLMLFFAFNKQAFCNYYFLVIGAMCCALSALYPKIPSSFS
ncbi:MAG: hypothetical protein HYZ22_01035 [Chloroflexi bacterium]|nr:hypothetical protein [Chloroflexota bacterium]